MTDRQTDNRVPMDACRVDCTVFGICVGAIDGGARVFAGMQGKGGRAVCCWAAWLLGKRCRQGWLKQVGCCWRVESSRAERVVKSITSIAGFLCLASAQQLSTGMEKSIELPSRPGSHGASA